MKELTRMKRITNLRDDLIEEAYLSDAIPVIPVSSFLPTPASGFVMGHAAKIAAAAVAGVLSVGVLVGAGLLAYKEWREPIVPPPVTTETTSDETQEPITEPPTHAEETESRKEEPVTDTEPVTETATETEPDTEIQLDVELQPETIQPGETVTVTVTAVVPAELEWVPCFSVYFTYGTVPVSKDILCYASEDGADVFTVTIPQNAPAGAYDLTVVCEGVGHTKLFEKVLTVLPSDETAVNPHVRITSGTNTVYPLQWEYGGRYVYAKDDIDAAKSWSYMFSDGVGYMDYSLNDPTTLPTVVWSNEVTVYYADSVLESGYFLVYDEEGKGIGYKELNDIELESGIYYFAIKGSYYGTDHTQEVLEAAKKIDDMWADEQPIMQEEVYKELEKDPLAFVDKTYCEHMIRVIIP